jgi:hypothetical protein
MSFDFQQVRQQVRQLGQSAPQRENRLQVLRQQARRLLETNAHDMEDLRQKVQDVVRSYDPSIRCAMPAAEPLNAHVSLPSLPAHLVLLAADGSQIFLDRHAAVEYFLINTGTFQMSYGEAQPPSITVQTDLYYGDDLNVAGAYPSEEKVSLLRDLRERQKLADLVEHIPGDVITLTDGRLELWGASPQETGGEASQPSASDGLEAFLIALERLQASGATAAGYVDKPSEDYVVRLLEVASLPVEQARQRPLVGVRDTDLFRSILAPGERSAIFEVQTRFANIYRRRNASFAPHFFYLNLGRPGHPWLARVDMLAWVAADSQRLDGLHAVLVHQCGMLGARPYPYALHRAHEIARVTPDEKAQLEMMIANELRKHGILAEESNKQFLKNL